MNEENKKKVDITPHVSLIPKLGYTGYKASEAIAEFIDNAIDAKPIDQKSVLIKITLKEDTIVVEDNASGMSVDELVNALRVAYSEKKKKLGKFGFGLKAAATSLGKFFEVKTTRLQDSEWHIIRYDEDEWLKNNSWESEIITERKIRKEDHGTIITINKTQYKFYPNLITNIKKQLSFRFNVFLKSNETRIKVNNFYIEPIEEDLIDDLKYPIEIDLGEGKKITGWYGFLTKRRGQQYGFNLYKNRRLIDSYKKIGFKPHPEVALIYGELNLDFVPVTHNKREFIEDSSEYKEVEEAMERFLRNNKVISRSREISKKQYFSLTETKIKKRLSILEEALKKSPLLEKISEIDVDSELDWEITNKDKIHKIKLSQKAFLPNNVHEEETYEFKIEDEKYEVGFGLAKLGKESNWVEYFVEGNKITVLVNVDFPLYSMVKNYPSYSLILVAEAISKFVVKKYKLNPAILFKIRNGILRRAGEAQIELENKIKMREERKKLLSRLAAIDNELVKPSE